MLVLCDTIARIILAAAVLGLPPAGRLFPGSVRGQSDAYQIEKRIRAYTGSEAFRSFSRDQRCHDRKGCRVYLIDNFEQDLYLVPEMRTSHGDMLVRLLQAGRDDIQVRILNTSLSKRLALVIQDLLEGVCVGCRRLLGARIELYLRADRQPAARSRAHRLPYRRGRLAFAPPVTPQHAFVNWLREVAKNPQRRFEDERVLKAGQIGSLK